MFNLGIGMILVVSAERVDEVDRAVEGTGLKGLLVGRVDSGTREVRLVGAP